MLNKKNFKEKPYNRCLFCDYRGVQCNGPRTSDMTLERWREFMRDMKEIEGLTYAEISKRSNIPSKTIEKKLSPGGDGQDIMRETARAIEDAILGSAQHPCYLAFLEENTDRRKNTDNAQVEIDKLLKEIEELKMSHKQELESVRSETQKKVDYLLAENQKKDKIIDRLLEK